MVLVFDVGGTAIKYCHMNKEGEIFHKHEISTKNIDSLEGFIQTLANIYKQNKSDIEGIALSCPGVINADTGVIEIIVALPYLQGVCITKELSKACDGIKVTLENDGKCAGLAEVWKGNAKNYDDSIMVVIGTGIGGAIIKDKRIHSGYNLFAGEISTIIVGYDKEKNKAIQWSDQASTTVLCRKGAKVLNRESINGRDFFELANQKDKRILKVLNEVCFDIAIQLFNLQYIYDPGIICIGGGISKQPLFIETIKEKVNEISNESNQLVTPNVDVCKYYNDANLIGALYNYLIR